MVKTWQYEVELADGSYLQFSDNVGENIGAREAYNAAIEHKSDTIWIIFCDGNAEECDLAEFYRFCLATYVTLSWGTVRIDDTTSADHSRIAHDIPANDTIPARARPDRIVRVREVALHVRPILRRFDPYAITVVSDTFMLGCA